MMHLLQRQDILSFYDVPQVFTALDEVDTEYVCLLAELGEEADKYLCVPVSKARLARLVDGELDLREVLETPESGQVFEGTAPSGDLRQLQIRPLSSAAIPHEWLPDPGFFVEVEPALDAEIVEEAKGRDRAVIHYTLTPPESAQEPKIGVDHLSEAITRFQKVVEWAYRKTMPDTDAGFAEEILLPENYQLEVFAFSPGSFTVHMQTVARADLVGFSHIARALDILDAVNRQAQEVEKAVELVGRYGGHFATQYKNWLRFIIDNGIPVAYEWSMPTRPYSTRTDVRPREAKPLYQELVRRKDIGQEVKTLVGVLTKVDANSGTWRLRDDQGREHTGHWDASSDVTLAGLVIRSRRYEFICEEKLEEQPATGKEFAKLYLMRYKEI